MPKIYDCFPFFNEIELLELRLHELDSVVDYFVVVEGGESFTGNKKSLHLRDNFERFEKFRHKIIYLKVDEFPSDATGWECERLQRDKLLEGIADAAVDDLILLSDIDEIPDSHVLVDSKHAFDELNSILYLQTAL